MSKEITTNQKHMTLNCRITIEKGLDSKLSLRKIGEQLCKDPTTISKEIKKHRITQSHNTFNEPSNKCSKLKECSKKDICQIYAPKCKRLCRTCSLCNSHCTDFEPRSYHCPDLDRAPFACNGCNKKSHCRLDKAYYRATTAHRQYRTALVESRAGINISEEGLLLLDELITPLILKGHSPYVILKNHPELKLSEKTIYNYIDSGALSVNNQEDINLMMSHINSSPRESLGGLTPLALARLMLPKQLLDYFALTEIAPDEVVLTPQLLKK